MRNAHLTLTTPNNALRLGLLDLSHMPLEFTKKYIKGYEFDSDKVEKAFECDSWNVVTRIQDKYQGTYIACACGRLPGDPPSTLRLIFVLDCGDDYEELKKRKIEDLHPWFEQAKPTTFTENSPDVYISEDYIDNSAS